MCVPRDTTLLFRYDSPMLVIRGGTACRQVVAIFGGRASVPDGVAAFRRELRIGNFAELTKVPTKGS